MLCRACEDKLNKWETYAAQVLFGGTKIEFERLQDTISVCNIDYVKFKLFQLSIIWRAGASTIQQFSNVKLGPHEDKLRSMLDKSNPGAPADYGCNIILTPSHFNLTSKMMMLAQETKFDSHCCYMFMMAGLTWVFFVSSHTTQLRNKNKMFLAHDGVLPILIEDNVSKSFFEKSVAEWHRSGNLDKAHKKI
jgi:hypothetical protein